MLKYEYKSNDYLVELLELIRKEFPEAAKNEDTLIDVVNRFYWPSASLQNK